MSNNEIKVSTQDQLKETKLVSFWPHMDQNSETNDNLVEQHTIVITIQIYQDCLI